MATFGKRGGIVVGLVLSSLAPLGCGFGGAGRNTARLQGTVTIDGKSLPADAQANITFKPNVGGQGRSSGAQIIDGHYDSPSTPKGKIKVFIDIQQPTGKMAREGIGSPYPEYRSMVAPKYGSGIDLDVTQNNPSQDFDLESR